MIKKSIQRIIVWLLIIALFDGIIYQNGMFGQRKVRAAEHGLSNPKIVADNDMEAGQKVTWDCVWFGSYPQTEISDTSSEIYKKLESAVDWNSNGDIVIERKKYRRISSDDIENSEDNSDGYFEWSNEYHYFAYEPIKWRVLEVKGDRAFLMAHRALDNQAYNDVYDEITWENCRLRKWLNGKLVSADSFIDNAFSATEQNAILDTYVNNDSYYEDVNGGSDTYDKIYLLSGQEACGTELAVSYGFIDDENVMDEARMCKATDYARAKGSWTDTEVGYKGNCFWWLRSQGFIADDAMYVDTCGDIYTSSVDDYNVGIRPVLNIDLTCTDVYSYAGTVCSDGTESLGTITLDEALNGTEGHTVMLSGKLMLDDNNPTEQKIEKAINDIKFSSSDSAVAKVISYYGVPSEDNKSADLNMFVALYNDGRACITANAQGGGKADCEVTVLSQTLEDTKPYVELYSSTVSEIMLNKGTLNVIKYLKNDANFTASTFIYENDPKFGSKLTTALTNLIYRGWDGWMDLVDASPSVRETEKMFVALIDETDEECVEMEAAKIAHEYAEFLANDFANYINLHNIEEVMDSGDVDKVKRFFSKEAIADLMFSGNYDKLKIGPDINIKTSQAEKEWNALMDGFMQSAEVSDSIKQLETLDKMGFGIEVMSLTQDTIYYMQRCDALMNSNEMYREMLQYIQENCYYEVAQDAALNLNNTISNKEQQMINDVKEAVLNLGADKSIDAVLEGFSANCMTLKMVRIAFDLGVLISNTFFNTASIEEAKSLLRSEVFVGECLSRWVTEKQIAYYSSIGTEAEDEKAKELYYSIYLLWKVRICSEETMQRYLELVWDDQLPYYSDRYRVSKLISNSLESYRDTVFSQENYNEMIGFMAACPVNVEVYDKAGNKVLEVKDGVESSGNENGIYYYCSYNPIKEDYEKYIYFDKQSGYEVKIVGNDMGLVDATVFDISEEGSAKELFFENIKIEKDDTIKIDDIAAENVEYKVKKANEDEEKTYVMKEKSAETIAATSISLSDSSLLMNIGEKKMITAEVLPVDASNQDVLWQSDNENVVKVNSYGVVEAVGQGTVIVTASLEGLKQNCQITVKGSEAVGQSAPITDNNHGNNAADNTAIYAVELQLSKYRYTYDGKAKKPGVVVKDNLGNVISPDNYTIAYKNNKKIGTATVTVTLKGMYSGTISETFTICPKGVKLKSITAKNKGFIVKWNKSKSDITGYKIQYSTSKKFSKKNTVTKTVKKKKAKLQVGKLKSSKKYYVRICTYKKLNGKMYCSDWSKTKKIIVKK